jgi:uncharacterized protein YecT (DUF1311 family)
MIVLLILAASPATNPRPYCESQSLPTQAQMNRCSALRAQAADAIMTREWDRASLAMKRLDGDPEASHTGSGSYFSALLTSQRAWLKFREAECRLEGYANRGGTLQLMTERDCYWQVTTKRTQQLRDLRTSFGQ